MDLWPPLEDPDGCVVRLLDWWWTQKSRASTSSPTGTVMTVGKRYTLCVKDIVRPKVFFDLDCQVYFTPPVKTGR
jgi:hypothetical protein